MIVRAGTPLDASGSRHPGGAVLVVAVYAIAGPPVGALFATPLAMLGAVAFGAGTASENVLSVLAAVPMGLLLSYPMAGALAFATGLIVAFDAHRHGRLSVRTAAVAPAVALVVLAAFLRIVHVDVPGTTILRGGGQTGMLIWIFVSIAASLVCRLIALSVGRRFP